MAHLVPSSESDKRDVSHLAPHRQAVTVRWDRKMKMTVVSAFGSFDDTLNLDPRERRQAQERHNQVRVALERSGLVGGSFLQGSFARKTMLKPLKDVDIVVLLKPASGMQGPDGPARAMELFQALVAAEWPTAVFDAGDAPSAKALRVEFDDLGFTIDLVPAFEDGGEWVVIGDREQRTWERSNTRTQIRLVRDRNGLTQGGFVHQVRMLKAFVKQQPGHEFDFFKGIAVESLAYSTISKQLPHDEAIAVALSQGARILQGPVMEPAGDDDVSAKWESGDRDRAVEVFTAAADFAVEAVDLRRQGDEHGAVANWHAIFGRDFPAAPIPDAEDALKAWASGSVTRSGRASSTTAGAAAAPGRSWRLR